MHTEADTDCGLVRTENGVESNVSRADNNQLASAHSSSAATAVELRPSNPKTLSVPERLVQTVKERILTRARKHLSSLDIVVRSNCVEAVGMASSFYAKQLVTHALLDGMPGIEIRNSLGVGPALLCDADD